MLEFHVTIIICFWIFFRCVMIKLNVKCSVRNAFFFWYPQLLQKLKSVMLFEKWFWFKQKQKIIYPSNPILVETLYINQLIYIYENLTGGYTRHFDYCFWKGSLLNTYIWGKYRLHC